MFPRMGIMRKSRRSTCISGSHGRKERMCAAECAGPWRQASSKRLEGVRTARMNIADVREFAGGRASAAGDRQGLRATCRESWPTVLTSTPDARRRISRCFSGDFLSSHRPRDHERIIASVVHELRQPSGDSPFEACILLILQFVRKCLSKTGEGVFGGGQCAGILECIRSMCGYYEEVVLLKIPFPGFDVDGVSEDQFGFLQRFRIQFAPQVCSMDQGYTHDGDHARPVVRSRPSRPSSFASCKSRSALSRLSRARVREPLPRPNARRSASAVETAAA